MRTALGPLLLVAGLIAAEPALARPRIELTPFLGMRGGADLQSSVTGMPPAHADPIVSFGMGVYVFVRPDGWFEAFVDHQTLSFDSDPGAFASTHFEVAVDYLQFGGGYEPGTGRIRPFVTAALGLTRYGSSSGEVSSTVSGSGSIGGGIRVPMGKRASFRFEVRGYANFGDASVSAGCGPGCNVDFTAGSWNQVAARGGVAIRLR